MSKRGECGAWVVLGRTAAGTRTPSPPGKLLRLQDRQPVRAGPANFPDLGGFGALVGPHQPVTHVAVAGGDQEVHRPCADRAARERVLLTG